MSRIQRARIPVLLVILSGLLLIGAVSATEFAPWSVETVASVGKVGQYSSIALDSAGHPAISYYDQTNRDLKYAAWDGSRWVITTVDSTKSVGEYSSLALDSSGNPRISYYDQTKADLKYASWDGTRWVISTVDGSSRASVRDWDRQHTYRDLDSSGRLKDHRWDDDRFGHGKGSSKNWKVGQFSSLALDSGGNPRISYYDQTNRDLKYAAWDGSKWVITTADSSGMVGEYSSLVLDSGGNPRISYYDQTKGDLKYAAWDGSRWAITIVDSSKRVGQFSSLALDSGGKPRISYYDQTKSDLKYAAWDGSRWVITTVDSSKKVGEYTSLKLDSNNDPRISYYDVSHSDLKFAAWNRTNSLWTTETVDSSGKVGRFASLALDSLGNPRISYYDQTNRNLKYVAGTGHSQPLPTGPTIISITPDNGVAGTSVSVTIDGANFVVGTTPAVWLAKSGENPVFATAVNVVSGTQITCTFSLPAPATDTIGKWDVSIRNADGQFGSKSAAFTVKSPVPVVNSIAPISGDSGTTVSATIAGSNFIVGVIQSVRLTKAGADDIIATGVTVSPSQITCTFPLPAASAATIGQWDVNVTNIDGQYGIKSGAFTVTAPAPTVTGITPISGDAGTTVSVTIAGTNFIPGTIPAVSLSKSGETDIIATGVTVISPTQITCTLSLPAPSGTNLGAWDVSVKNPDGKTGTKSSAFTVNANTPTLTWDWSIDGWGDWGHTASWVGTETGPCSEYGPIIVNGHGEHGTAVNLDRGSTESSVSKIFTADYGAGWDTITFNGLLSYSGVPDGRWMTIEVNGLEVFGATALDTPPGNGQQFTITQAFPQSNSVTIEISEGQNPAWGPLFMMQFDSITLSKSTTLASKSLVSKASMSAVRKAFVKPDGSIKVGNETQKSP
jgi:hypothetical protein